MASSGGPQGSQPLDANQLIASLTSRRLLGKQFQEIQALKSSSNPNFVAEMLKLYIGDSQQKVLDLERHLAAEEVDEGRMDHSIHQLKGSSATIGADGVVQYCVALRHYCVQRDYQHVRHLVQQLKHFMQSFLTELQLLAELEMRSIAQQNSAGAQQASSASSASRQNNRS